MINEFVPPILTDSSVIIFIIIELKSKIISE